MLTKVPLIVILNIFLFCCVSAKAQQKNIKTEIQTGHQSRILSYDVSPDQHYLATVDLNRKIIIWDVNKERQLYEFTNDEIVGGIQKVLFNPQNPNQIYIAGTKGQQSIPSDISYSDYKRMYIIIDWRNNKKVGIIREDELQKQNHLFGNISYEIKNRYQIVRVDKNTNREQKKYFGLVSMLGGIDISKNDRHLLVSGNNPQVWNLYDLTMRKLEYQPFVLSQDSTMIVSDDRVIPLKKSMQSNFNNDRFEYYPYGYKNYFEGKFLNDSLMVLGGYGAEATVWDMEGNLKHKIPSEGYPVFTVENNKDLFLAGTYNGLAIKKGKDSPFILYKELNNQISYAPMNTVKIYPEQNVFFIGCDGGEILRGHLDDPQSVTIYDNVGFSVMGMDINKQRNQLLVSSEYGSIRLYNLLDSTVSVLSSPIGQERMSCCAFLTDDIIVTGSNNGYLSFWKNGKKESYKQIKAHNGEVCAITNTDNNGKHFFTSSKDGMVKIWDIATLEEIAACVALKDGDEYIIVTPDFYYKSSKGQTTGIHFVDGVKVYDFEQFDLYYNRPDIIMERLGLVSKEEIAIYKKAWEKRLRRLNYDEKSISPDFHTPELEITNRENIAETMNSNHLQLLVNAADSIYKLNRMLVWINGVPVFTTNGIDLSRLNTHKLDYTLDIELARGLNKIDVSCLNENGVESYKQTLNVTYEPGTGLPKPDLYIACIGSSMYKQSDFNLRYAHKDAEDMVMLFSEIETEKYNKIYTKLLRNEDVTIESVKALGNFFKDAKRDDAIILFYAGHGVLDSRLDYYLGTYDIDFANPKDRGLPYETIETLLDDVKPLQKLIMVDACHSGELDKEDVVASVETSVTDYNVVFRNVGNHLKKPLSTAKVNLLVSELFSDIRRGIGAVILSSAGGGELAVEGSQWNNGLFTWVVKNGIESKEADLDKNGVITTSELKSYTQEKVTALSQGRQKPTYRIDNAMFYFDLF